MEDFLRLAQRKAVWMRWQLWWVCSWNWLDSTSSASASGENTEPTFCRLVQWRGCRLHVAGIENIPLLGLGEPTVELIICLCLPPDRTWHKVNDLKVGLSYHIYQPLRSGRIWHQVNFFMSLIGLNSEFSIF